jgi:hypothetical protein
MASVQRAPHDHHHQGADVLGAPLEEHFMIVIEGPRVVVRRLGR